MWTKLLVFVIFFGLIQLSSGLSINYTQKHVRIRMKSVGCSDINYNFVSNYTCFLKPTRDGAGLATFMIYGLKNTSDLWFQLRFFYKTGPKLQQFGPVFDWDFCRRQEQGAVMNHPFIEHMRATLIARVPNVFHKCPFEGIFGTEKFNAAEIFENALPQVIPTGTYKSIWTFHSKNSTVYFSFWGVSEVKAVDVMKSYEM